MFLDTAVYYTMATVIFPPRPKSAIPPTELQYYDNSDQWVAQYKYNGSRCVIHIEPGGNVSIWGREGAKHRSYVMPFHVRDQLQQLPGLDKAKEYWLDGELMIKTSAEDTKGKIVLFDVLQAGKYLFMVNQMDRLKLLDEICGHPKILDPWRGMGLQISQDILMAPTFTRDFVARFKEKIQFDEMEGLVLRRRNSVLDNFGAKEYEIGWVIRCRKPHKNYNF